MKIGLLTQPGAPLLPPILAALRREDSFDLVVLVDEEPASVRNTDLWKQRTGGYFDSCAESNKLLSDVTRDRTEFTQFHFDSHNSDEMVLQCVKLGVDILVNAGTPRILKPSILEVTPWGVLNVHPGLLPEFRGCSCVEWALWHGASIGVSAHQMREAVDAGPVFAQRELSFSGTEGYVDIRIAVYLASIDLMRYVLKEISTGRFQQRDLREQDELHARYWPPIPAQIERKVMINPWRA